ncbi:putative GPI-anchored protein PB15E9.01c [Stegastes partitus]|uniref:GPI-anchored protein PB15E9.01c n=1 Tax=Stegastes partitus TaxID=144197 RepID=A0A3B4ZCD9_9TELE|nr:PREDICTED: putative GPI-anchored protein PB15E9.01c [Stegastes partitus]
MRFEIQLVLCVSVVLSGASQTRGQSHDPPAVFTPPGLLSHTEASASPDPAEDPGNEAPQRTRNPAGGDETSHETTTLGRTEGSARSEAATTAALQTDTLTSTPAAPTSPAEPTAHLSTAAAADSLSSTPTALSAASLQDASTPEGRTPLTSDSLTAFSSQLAHTVKDASSAAPTSATESLTTANPETSAPGRAPDGPTHQEVPSELNVGDEDLKRSHYRSSSPLDPLLAGLLSVFIVTTAIVFVILFLKFRQRTNHPEFHRLQDLPMDDLMEDTPLSRYSY